MKYVKWNRTKAFAAVCAVVIIFSAVSLTASADDAEVTQTEMQQNMPNRPQGRNRMHGGSHKGGQRMPFGDQDWNYAPPADGEQLPEMPDGDFTPPTDGRQRPARPGCVAPSTDGEQLPEIPNGEFIPPAEGEQPPEMPDGDFTPPTEGEQPPEMPNGDFAPPTDGEQPPVKPEGQDPAEKAEESESPDQADQNALPSEGFNGGMRKHFKQSSNPKNES